MANPFTRFLRTLRKNTNTPDINTFISHWDIIEIIVVDVHKRGHATPEEQHAYHHARTALLSNYPQTWSPRFAPHWPPTLEAGHPTPADPFPRILAPENADGFVNNWPALQALAAARETLNRYILTA